MARELRTEITIDAPPQRVWEILADNQRFPEWNPFVIQCDGPLEIGARLNITVQPPGGKPASFKPVVLVVEPAKELRWRGSLPIPGLFIGEHAFELEPEKGGTRFIHSEHFTGLLVPLIWPSMGEPARAGFELMNEALKARAESNAAS